MGFLTIFFINAEGVNYDEIDAKDPETLTEVEKIALLGRPRLGDVTKIQIRIKESKEFKVWWIRSILLKHNLIPCCLFYLELGRPHDAAQQRVHDDGSFFLEGPVPGGIHRTGRYVRTEKFRTDLLAGTTVFSKSLCPASFAHTSYY